MPVGVDDIDPDTAAADSGHHGPQRRRSTTPAADHLAEIVGMNPDLQGAATTPGGQIHPDVVGVIDDAPDQMLQGLGEHAHADSAASAGAASAGAASSAGFSALAAFFFGVVAGAEVSAPIAASAAS